jgi:K+-sensing histidine kinase KdpD
MATASMAVILAPGKRVLLGDVRRQHELFADDTILREVLNSVPTPSAILNLRQQIVFGNRAFLHLASVTSEDALLGLRLGEALHCVHADKAIAECGSDEFCSTFGAAQALSSVEAGQASAKECHITRAGAGGEKEAVDLMVSVQPITVAGETFLNCSMLDISRERRRRVRDRVFFHDLLNSAAGLILSADAIQNSTAPQVIAKFSKVICSSSLQMVAEIQSHECLLAAENGELENKPSWFSTLDLLTSFSEQYQQQFIQRGCTLSMAAETADIRVCSDQTLLGRVLGNMLKNALEASTPGSTVTFGSRAVSSDFEIWVNNPQCMPMAVQHQVFQRSFSTKSSARGLGSYSMRLISERYLHGTVRFFSDKVTGTTFCGRYPVQPASSIPTGKQEMNNPKNLALDHQFITDLAGASDLNHYQAAALRS